jgi:hypothetical protein
LNSPIRFELSGAPEARGTAAADNTIVATRRGTWGGATQLPTTGTLRFTNNGTAPHQLYLQPVVDGTTAQEVLDWFVDNPLSPPGPGANAHGSLPPPPWVAPGPRLALEPVDAGGTETRAYAGYAPGPYLAWEQVAFDGLFPPTMLAIVHIGD